MSSLKLFTVRGIPIRMHITFPLILVWAALQFGLSRSDWLTGAAFGIVVTALLFACVVLHELAHSLVAVRFGSLVKEIVLLPLGGVAQMERIPERPYQEMLMALAGPLTSGLIGGVLATATLLLFPLSIWGELVLGDIQWSAALPYLAVVNLFLAAFNLIPAFPMDGGRVLRALMAMVMPYARATAIAVAIGQGLAWLLGLGGLWSRNILMVLVAVFVYFGATQEGRMVQIKTALAGLRVRQVFSHHPEPVTPDDPLGRAVDLMLEGFQSDFPVCEGERLVGMLTRSDVLVGLKEQGAQTPIRQAMRRQFLAVGPNDDLFDVQQKMAQGRLDAVPVVDGETFLGLLTRQDLEDAYRLVSVLPGLLRSGGR